MLATLQYWVQIDPIEIIKTGSYVAIGLIVFAESGILLGLFLPGDSLLFIAGLLAAQGILSPWLLVPTVVIAAVAGDTVGYWFGAKVGPRIFSREDSRFFKQEYLRRTQHFYETYGGRAIILARFVPIVRTLAPILAGVGSMNYRRFAAYNVIGGTLWGAGVVSIGYTLGAVIPHSDRYVLPFSLLVIVLSLLPILSEIIRNRRTP